MTDRIVARVLCEQHGRGMGVVRATREGLVFETHKRTLGIARPPSLNPSRDPTVEQYRLSKQHTGTVPAWCPRCHDVCWIDADTLRAAGQRGTNEAIIA